MFRTRITPRVSETDGAGHVNNTVAPIWFEAGRREIFRIFTPDLDFADWRVALVSMSIDYRAQIFYDAGVEVRTWVQRIGNKSFTLYEEIWQGAELCVSGTATYVCYDYRRNRAVPIPNDRRVGLSAHLKVSEADPAVKDTPSRD